jgi:hypothetical protein
MQHPPHHHPERNLKQNEHKILMMIKLTTMTKKTILTATDCHYEHNLQKPQNINPKPHVSYDFSRPHRQNFPQSTDCSLPSRSAITSLEYTDETSSPACTEQDRLLCTSCGLFHISRRSWSTENGSIDTKLNDLPNTSPQKLQMTNHGNLLLGLDGWYYSCLLFCLYVASNQTVLYWPTSS